MNIPPPALLDLFSGVLTGTFFKKKKKEEEEEEESLKIHQQTHSFANCAFFLLS